jgi:sensor histidine kinase YesM
MIKDKYFKSLLIPFLGLTIPMAARLVDYSRLSPGLILFSACFFIIVSQLIWYGAIKLQVWLRTHSRFRHNVAQKLSVLLLINTFYSMVVAALSSAAWQLVVQQTIVLGSVITAAAITVVAVIILTLIYESLFLSAEIALDAKVMQQLDKERQQAESSVLKNELDPHFLFNSLNALSYLVRAEPEKAYQFVHKLSNVFKYLLLNKQKDFVSLEEEMAYLDDYYFLLQVRFDDGIQLNKMVNGAAKGALILPCTLQALVENAIKHNFFSDKEPLVISIEMNEEFISVSNPLRPKSCKGNSTKTGLQNLRSRYQFVMKKSILVQKTSDRFLVTIPFKAKK